MGPSCGHLEEQKVFHIGRGERWLRKSVSEPWKPVILGSDNFWQAGMNLDGPAGFFEQKLKDA